MTKREISTFMCNELRNVNEVKGSIDKLAIAITKCCAKFDCKTSELFEVYPYEVLKTMLPVKIYEQLK